MKQTKKLKKPEPIKNKAKLQAIQEIPIIIDLRMQINKK